MSRYTEEYDQYEVVLSQEQFDRVLGDEIQRRMHMDRQEFETLLRRGQLPDNHEVRDLEHLIQFSTDRPPEDRLFGIESR